MAVRLSETDAANYLALSVKTLRKWRGSGNGPVFIKAGRAIRYCTGDLDRWLDANRRKSTSDSGAHEELS